jgi:hypothetical protein
MGAVPKSYMRKGFLINEEMRNHLVIYEEAVSHIWLCNRSLLDFLIYEENIIFNFDQCKTCPLIRLRVEGEGGHGVNLHVIPFYFNWFYLTRFVEVSKVESFPVAACTHRGDRKHELTKVMSHSSFYFHFHLHLETYHLSCSGTCWATGLWRRTTGSAQQK